ncbi:MAG: hypothetical protein QGG54_08200 [Gammaproteobacteria bacterium]|nr:hypothetical protein [Gammaproteobacteria bacterium]
MVRGFVSMRATVFLLSISLSAVCFAQDNVGDDSTVRYPASYFSEWSPVTAQDMLDRIPGLSSGGGFGGPGSFGGGGFSGPPFGAGGFGGPPEVSVEVAVVAVVLAVAAVAVRC